MSEGEIFSARDLDVVGLSGDDDDGLADCLDELGVVSGCGFRDAACVSLDEPIAAKSLWGLNGMQPGARNGLGDFAVVAHALEGIGNGNSGDGGAVLDRGLKDGVDGVRLEARPRGVVDGDHIAGGVHGAEHGEDGFVAFFSPINDLYIDE